MTPERLQALATGLMALAALLFVLRIARAAMRADRILALESAGLTLVGFLLLQGDRAGGHDFLDAALTLALLSFVATIALSRSISGEASDE